MKTILIINAIVAILNIIMLLLLRASTKAEFVKLYPTAKLEKVHISEKISAILRMVIMSICPLINILYLFDYIFKWEILKESIIDNLRERMIEE